MKLLYRRRPAASSATAQAPLACEMLVRIIQTAAAIEPDVYFRFDETRGLVMDIARDRYVGVNDSSARACACVQGGPIAPPMSDGIADEE